MSGKIRQRGSANTEKAMNPMNTNERILKVCPEFDNPFYYILIHSIKQHPFLDNFPKPTLYLTGLSSTVYGP